jgi:class 3 adenylate cyclase
LKTALQPTPVGATEAEAVTVLFVDVQGSIALAEQVDAEEWHGIVDRFFQILAAIGETVRAKAGANT